MVDVMSVIYKPASLRGRFQREVALGFSLLLTSFVVSESVLAASASPPLFSSKKIELHGRSLELHLGMPQGDLCSNILVIYASGDGGWFGTAVEMFKEIAQLGFPVAGFSARSYLKLLGYSTSPISAEELTLDYESLIQAATQALALPSKTPAVLAGWSRGAAFAVLVGAEKKSDLNLAGVVAIGLPDKEELNIRIHQKKILIANFPNKRQHMIFDTYEKIPDVAPLPLSLIQSTQDDYLPASAARALFGVESSCKKFFAVKAQNHRFSGGKTEFLHTLKESLNWILRVDSHKGT